MGVGTGFAIAAAVCTSSQPLVSRRKPHPPVYCIQGDSAFGFSGMEIETAYRYVRVKYCEEMFLFWFRYKLPIVFIIINNSGIYQGLPQEQWEDVMKNEDPYVK